MILNIYKPIGLTPLQVINKYKKRNPKFKEKKLGYAGRLDPLAHGVLLIMVAPSTKKGKQYQNLSKKYVFSVLLGIETDTYDTLGIITNTKNKQVSKKDINKVLNKFIGKQIQPYPIYSSMSFKGKPLFWWARKGLANKVQIPEKEIEIFSLNLIKVRDVSIKSLQKKILSNIKKVKGDFRQEKIIKSWNGFCKTTKTNKLKVLEIEIKCSSGTYVRSIANNIGKKLQTHAIALDILRTQAGNYKIKDSIRLEA